MSFKLSAEAEEDIIAIAEQGVRMFGAGQAKRRHEELFALFAAAPGSLISSQRAGDER